MRGEFVVGNDCRPVEDGFKRSFHIVWHSVLFQNNHTDMKQFINDLVKPKIKAQTELQWNAVLKNGLHEKWAVDYSIYTKNRAFRVIYANKKGKSCIVPWDIEKWQELIFDSQIDKENWFEQSLVSGADTEDVALMTHTKPLDRESDDLEQKQCLAQHERKQNLSELKSSGDKAQQRSLTTQLVSFLKIERSSGEGGWDVWAKVVWAIHSVFEGILLPTAYCMYCACMPTLLPICT
jgi:hypothetical protein